MRSFFLFSSLCVYARARVCVMCVSACIILRHSTFFFAALDHINMQIFQFHIGNHKKYIKRRCKASAEDCVVQLLGIHSCARTHKMNKMIPSLLLHLSCGRGTYTHITYIAGHTCRFVTRKENLLRLFVERGWACVCCVYVCRITSLTLLRFYFNEKKVWSRHLSLLFLFVCRLQMNMNMMDETQWTWMGNTRMPHPHTFQHFWHKNFNFAIRERSNTFFFVLNTTRNDRTRVTADAHRNVIYFSYCIYSR